MNRVSEKRKRAPCFSTDVPVRRERSHMKRTWSVISVGASAAPSAASAAATPLFPTTYDVTTSPGA